MRCTAALLLAVSVSFPAAAGEWAFGEPLNVAEGGAQVFHHLEAAGRRSMAVQGGTVAIVWEDNHSGRPRAYVAFRSGAEDFTPAIPVSGPEDAYAPAVVGIDDGRFLVGWEENRRVWLRVAGPRALGSALPVVDAAGAQITLARGPAGRLYVAWADESGDYPRVRIAPVTADGLNVRVGAPVAVDPEPPRDAQLYPTVAVTEAGVTVAWEDRRHGHTRLLYRHGDHALAFTAPIAELNERPPPMSTVYGRGSGVTRVALAARGGVVAATWMDKREFRGGYDIYGALSADGGRTFGGNEKVQDLFGENIPQWHPDVAVAPDGLVVVAWDDSRDDAADVWLSWRADGQWSDDLALPGGHGEGMQSHPVVTFGADGTLHAAWVNRGGDGTSAVRYLQGRYQAD